MRFPDSDKAQACIDTVLKIMNKSLVGDVTERQREVIGWRVLSTTTWRGDKTDAKSKKREWDTVAKAAVVEHRRMLRFRKKLVTLTPVAHFRRRLEAILSDFAIPKTVAGKQVYEWRFPDNFSPKDVSNVEQLEKLTVEQRLLAVSASNQAQEYRSQVLKVVRSVQNSGVATIDGTPNAPLERNVYDALRALVEVGTCVFF